LENQNDNSEGDSPAGKSRAHQCTPVTLEVLRKIGSRLMDIPSQHGSWNSGKQFFNSKLIDFICRKRESKKCLSRFLERNIEG